MADSCCHHETFFSQDNLVERDSKADVMSVSLRLNESDSLTFIHSDEGLTLETVAFESLYVAKSHYQLS